MNGEMMTTSHELNSKSERESEGSEVLQSCCSTQANSSQSAAAAAAAVGDGVTELTAELTAELTTEAAAEATAGHSVSDIILATNNTTNGLRESDDRKLLDSVSRFVCINIRYRSA